MDSRARDVTQMAQAGQTQGRKQQCRGEGGEQSYKHWGREGVNVSSRKIEEQEDLQLSLTDLHCCFSFYHMTQSETSKALTCETAHTPSPRELTFYLKSSKQFFLRKKYEVIKIKIHNLPGPDIPCQSQPQNNLLCFPFLCPKTHVSYTSTKE